MFVYRQPVAALAGLMWDNLQNEHWFERLPVGSGAAPTPEAPASRLQRHLSDWEVRPATDSHCLIFEGSLSSLFES